MAQSSPEIDDALRLILCAAEHRPWSAFVSTALEEVRRQLSAEDVFLFRAIEGTWQSLRPTVTAQEVPLDLLSNAADTGALERQSAFWAVVLPPQFSEKLEEVLVLAVKRPHENCTRPGETNAVAPGKSAVQTVAAAFAVALRFANQTRDARAFTHRLETLLAVHRLQLTGTDVDLTELANLLRSGLNAIQLALLAPVGESTKTFRGVLASAQSVDSVASDETSEILTAVLRSSQPVRFQLEPHHDPAGVSRDTKIDPWFIRSKAPAAELCGIRIEDELRRPLGVMLVWGSSILDCNSKDAYLASLVEIAVAASPLLRHAWKPRGTHFSQSPDPESDDQSLVGAADVMSELRERLQRVAATDLPVLLVGENGTGKEIASRAIHAGSPRRNGPFVAVNCAALSETLLESELFGHEKGAFTDAMTTRAGRFELARDGTLFLDEVGEMSLRGQAKLLRALEEKVIVRVGGSEEIPTNARVIAATNRDLPAMVRDETFREDLFFRLNAVMLQLPPLRNRGQDVLLLADRFVEEFSPRRGDGRRFRISGKATDRLLAHRWPGNVRELRNVIQRAVHLARGPEITVEDLGLPSAITDHSASLNEATRDFQIGHIENQIAASAGNMTEAAKRLGLHRSNLYRKMRQLGMNADEDAP